MLGALALTAVVAATFLFTVAVARCAGEHRLTIAVAVSLGLLATVPPTLGRLFDSLFLAAVLFGTVGVLGAVALTRYSLPSAPEPIDARLYPWSRVASLVLFGLVAWASIVGFWWDEYSCHFPLVAVLARGVLPPEFPLFPGEPFRYHYGFDALAALVRAFTGADVALSIDVAAIACFGALLGVAKAIGAQLGGRVGASLAVVLVPLGAGPLQYLLFVDMGTMQVRWSTIPASWAESMAPPVISNFFQHPQGLGMVLAIAALCTFTDGRSRVELRLRRCALATVLLICLSLAQIVFFGVVGLMLGFILLHELVRESRRTLVIMQAVLLAIALPGAWLLGGFLAPGSETENMLVFGRGLYPGTLFEILLRYAVYFGLPFLLLPWAMPQAFREGGLRWALALGAVFCFVVPSVVSYRRSWDIVKFLGVGMVWANVLFVDVLARASTHRVRRFAVGAAVMLTTVSSFVWLLRMSVFDGRFGVPPMHFPGPSALAASVADRLEPWVGPRDRVFSTNVDLAQAGGVLTPGFNWRQVGRGFMLDRTRADALYRAHSRARHGLADRDLDTLGVEVLVFSDGDLRALTPKARAALDGPRFEHLLDVRRRDDVRHVYRRRSDR